MPTFIFTSPDGQEYHVDGPDGATQEQAWEQLQKQLGTTTKKPAIPGQENEETRVQKLKQERAEKAKANPYANFNEALFGAGETTLNVGSGLFAGVQAPIAAGVKRAFGMVPDWEKETARLVQEQTYQPRTEKGQDMAQAVGEFVNRYIAPMGPGNITGLAQAKGGVPLRTPKEPTPTPVVKPKQLPTQTPVVGAPDGLPMAVEGDLFNKRAYQQELPLASSVETIADMQRAKYNPNQLDLFGDNSGGERMPYDAEGIVLREQAAKAAQEAQAARTAQEHAAALERYRQAQNAIEQRQQAMQQEVARQTSLDQNAAQRARQEAAPTGYSTWEANRQVEDATRSAEQLRQLNERGQQMGIVEDFGNNDPMSRVPNMRVDENGIPIRADLSMEAQNLQNPLQRNLWGDELPVSTGDNGVPLTQALDKMPPGPARDAAVSQLSGQPVNPMALTDAVNSKLRRPGLPGRAGRGGVPGGAIHPQVFEDLYKFGKSVIRAADGMLMPLYHGTDKEFRTIKASTEGGALGNGVYTAVRPQYANGYAEGLGGNVHQVYVDIRKPLVIDGPGDPMINALISLGETREKAIKIVERAYDEKGYITNEVRARARRQGYDGIVLKRNGQMSEVVAFDAKQVKSAISGDNNPPARKMTEKEITGDWEAEPDTWQPGRSSIRKSGRFGQQGAMDVRALHDVVNAFKSGIKSEKEVLEAFRETYHSREISRLQDDLVDPKARSTVVLMSPEQFKDLAKHRTTVNERIWTEKVASIKEGLKSEEGLRQVPILFVKNSPVADVLQVEGHEGRHRMDVFQQNQLDLVPVEIRHSTGRWGEMDQFPSKIIGEEHNGIQFFPRPMTTRYGSGKFGQGGSIHPDLLTLGIPKLIEKVFSKEKEPVSAYLEKLPGLRGKADEFITRPTASSDLLEAAKTESDGPSLFTNLQSGLTMAAQKTESTMLKNMAQWFNWSQNRANFLVKEAVVPLESRLAHLRKDLSSLHQTFIDEMFQGTMYSPEQLAERGLNQKTIDAYNSVRQAYDMFLAEQNKARELLGKAPITRQDAYMASVFRGDYHIPVMDKSGKLRWYIQTDSKRQAKAAIDWLKKEYADHPEIDVSNLNYKHDEVFRPGRKYAAVPRDVMASWKDIAEAMGDDPLAAELKQAMEQWVADKGEHAFRQDLHHVREKVNVRGFEGDQPWMNADKNAHNWAKAQIGYLKDAARWSATQEAISNAKTFLTDPTILQNQPNNVSLAKAYLYNHMGLTENLARRLEDGIAGSLGVSRSFANDLGALARTGVYFKTLVASPAYIVATPLQAIWASLGHFDMAKQQGLVKSNYIGFIKNMFEAMADERAGAPMSSFNKEALKWAEDNGVIQNIVYEDNRSIGTHALTDLSQKALDVSIGTPDRFARRTVFLPFANALWESGKFATKQEAFMKAGEIADAVAVSMRPQDRPLAVQKLGQLGAMAYQFHAPILNMYNNLSTFAHHGKRTGDWMPLAKSLLAMGAVGGVFSLPLVNELEKASQLVKDAIAHFAPSKYKYVKDFDPRLAVLQTLPDTKVGELLSFGGASVATGADLRSRFSNEIINTEDPLGSVFPSTSVYGDMISSGAKFLADPNRYTGMQALKSVAPGGLARGMLETNRDEFKSAMQPYASQGITSFRKPSDITEPGVYVNRTPSETTAKRYGFTALTESVRREKDAISDKEKARLTVARKGVFDSMFKAIVNKTGDENTVREAVQNYLALEGNPQDIEKQLERKFADLPFTRQQLDVMKAKRYEQIMNVVRRMKMDRP